MPGQLDMDAAEGKAQDVCLDWPGLGKFELLHPFAFSHAYKE